MDDAKTKLKDMITALRRQRDELAVQVHLGNAEAKEEFDAAKAKLDSLLKEYEPLKDAVEESADNVVASLQLVGDELLKSFDRIRKSL